MVLVSNENILNKDSGFEDVEDGVEYVEDMEDVFKSNDV
jgi:hypothetical protein